MESPVYNLAAPGVRNPHGSKARDRRGGIMGGRAPVYLPAVTARRQTRKGSPPHRVATAAVKQSRPCERLTLYSMRSVMPGPDLFAGVADSGDQPFEPKSETMIPAG